MPETSETLYAQDEETGTWYRIDSWAYSGDGTPVSKWKEEVPKDCVPPKFHNSILGRDVRDWSDKEDWQEVDLDV